MTISFVCSDKFDCPKLCILCVIVQFSSMSSFRAFSMGRLIALCMFWYDNIVRYIRNNCDVNDLSHEYFDSAFCVSMIYSLDNRSTSIFSSFSSVFGTLLYTCIAMGLLSYPFSPESRYISYKRVS